MILRIATVEFLNALPFLTVLRKLHQKGEVELVEAIPSECARLLRDDEVDVALLPVGALDQFEWLEVVSRFCIGCVGPVRTVKLFSSVPVGQIKQVVLDPASRSSNQLVRILLKDLWNNPQPEWVYPDKARPMTQTAYVYIGDKVFGLENQFPHEYDLGEAWKEWTGLPFVFALWVSKSSLPEPLILQLDQAFQQGLEQLEQTILDMDPPLDERIGLSYFSESISYPLDAEKIRGLKKFLQLAQYPENLHFSDYLKY